MHTHRVTTGLALAALLALGGPERVTGQDRLSVDARGGVAVPASDLADVTDVGASVGVGFSYDVSPRVALRLDGDVDILPGADSGVSGSSAPDINIFHYGGGVAVSLLDPSASRWTVDVNLGGGASTFDVDSFSAGGATVDFSETYFTTNGGLGIGYDVSSSVGVFARGQAYLMFTDEDDTAVFNQVSSDVDPSGFDTAWTFPITAGIALRF